jgi:hypothetical protein
MHYSPRIWPERDPELRLIFLSFPLSPPVTPQGACGGRLLVAHDSLSEAESDRRPVTCCL